MRVVQGAVSSEQVDDEAAVFRGGRGDHLAARTPCELDLTLAEPFRAHLKEPLLLVLRFAAHSERHIAAGARRCERRTRASIAELVLALGRCTLRDGREIEAEAGGAAPRLLRLIVVHQLAVLCALQLLSTHVRRSLGIRGWRRQWRGRLWRGRGKSVGVLLSRRRRRQVAIEVGLNFRHATSRLPGHRAPNSSSRNTISRLPVNLDRKAVHPVGFIKRHFTQWQLS